MHFIISFFQFLAHLDIHLQTLTANYGSWVYAILFLIIFCETGLVVTPLLPGDSLLFAAGSVAALGGLNPHVLFLLLTCAALLGNNTNYFIGRWVGKKLRGSQDPTSTKVNIQSRWIKQKYFDEAHGFYERHGARAIVLAQFIPIVRTFIPFVAGVAVMTYQRFLRYNIAGVLIWVGSLTYISYFFGNITWVKQHFSVIIYAIIIISMIPVCWTALRQLCCRHTSSQ